MSEMNISEAEQVVQTLKEQVAELQRSVFKAKAERVADFESDKPRLKALLTALNKQRVELKQEVTQLQAAIARGAASQVQGARGGVSTGFNAIKGKTGADGRPMSEADLEREARQVRESLATIDSRIQQAKRELAGMRDRDEQDIWETNLVILQDTRRMQKEELALLEGELLGRSRLAQAAAERAAAEASGELALARTSEKLLQAEARIDRLKQQLFFPACKGYTFALGSSGIYFGGKDMIVSEVSGSWAVKAETGLVDKKGTKGARLSLQIGMPQQAPPQRARNSMGTRPVSDALKLRMATGRAGDDPADDASSEADAPTTSARPPRPEELGNTRGKRMAMKFVNKIANKDKYTQGLQGVRKGLDSARTWAAEKARTNGSDSPSSAPGTPSGIRASISNKLGKAKSSAGRGLQKVGRAGRQLGHLSSRSESDDAGGGRGGVSAYAGLGPTGAAQDDLAEAVADDAGDWSLDGSEEFDSASVGRPQRSLSEVLETGSSRSGGGGGGGDASSVGGRQGMLVAVRCMEVALVGERGSKVPNFALQELSLELDFQLSVSWHFHPVTGWRAAGKPVFEINSLAREVKGNTVPLPKTLLKLILTLVMPRVLQRKIQALLPVELGRYLAEAGQGVHVAGDISIVGPALSSLDADLAFQDPQDTTKIKDAKKNASHFAAAQEARNMLGLTPPQAAIIAELFGGRLALLEPPRPCTLGALQAYYSVFAAEARAWEQLGAVWSTAARMANKVYRAGEAPDFLRLMDGSVAQLAKKPVRAKLQVTRLDVGVSVDAALDAVRDYFVRSAKEAHSRGTFLDLSAEDPEATAPEGYQPLEVQLEALEAFHTWWVSQLRTFKGKFKEAGGTFLAAADARSFSTGVENARYEGPIKLEIPIPLESLEPDGAWTFELPLPNPERQETFTRFVEGLRAAIATPLSMIAPTARSANETADEIVDGAGSLWDSSPAEWFASLQGSTFGKTLEEATTAMGPLPETLGKVVVNGMRLRVKLDEERIAELVKDMDAASVPGLLRHLGEIASLSFVPFRNDETGQVGYMIRLESSDAANLSAEAVCLGYKSGDGLSPGRLLRTAQALARAIMLTLKMPRDHVREVDAKMEEVYDVLIREALDASACLEGLATLSGGSLVLLVSGAPDPDNPDAGPGHFENDVDLAPLVAGLMASDIEAANDERVARQLGFGRRGA